MIKPNHFTADCGYIFFFSWDLFFFFSIVCSESCRIIQSHFYSFLNLLWSISLLLFVLEVADSHLAYCFLQVSLKFIDECAKVWLILSKLWSIHWRLSFGLAVLKFSSLTGVRTGCPLFWQHDLHRDGTLYFLFGDNKRATVFTHEFDIKSCGEIFEVFVRFC